jgi:hypothetical protein
MIARASWIFDRWILVGCDVSTRIIIHIDVADHPGMTIRRRSTRSNFIDDR